MTAAPPRNPFFPAVVIGAGLFGMTALAMIAATLGDPDAPPNRFFDAWGVHLIVAEMIVVLAVSCLALALDRRQTLQTLQRGAMSDDDRQETIAAETRGQSCTDRRDASEAAGGDGLDAGK